VPTSTSRPATTRPSPIRRWLINALWRGLAAACEALPVKSRAAVFRGPGRPLEVREIDLEEPGPNDVLVRMAAVGICRTELHSIRGEWDPPTPSVLDHEGAGGVEAVGSPGRVLVMP
jgi:Alcohol dehydrogenase GroES-like domain